MSSEFIFGNTEKFEEIEFILEEKIIPVKPKYNPKTKMYEVKIKVAKRRGNA